MNGHQQSILKFIQNSTQRSEEEKIHHHGKFAKANKLEVILNTLFSPFDEGESRGMKITVKDNVPGIPSQIKAKILQPFFTTKPTGSGTGLEFELG